MPKKPTGLVEGIIWVLALLGIYFFGSSGEHHFSLCPLDMLGLPWCPGCGLGRSMHHLMMGQFQLSWELHPLGSFALLVIVWRIVTLIHFIKKQKKLWQMY
ncbi:DUF2752 domain-containing protein [Cyclobacterium lianum]|uniref:DUF2752 domain-containing protein n=1 Tax=Cyclobacterium lianum TaxID=388280 RepID=UPI000932211B|nr:DUF2752 domain-containing protein [Cyclobacterium lianum]